MLTVLKWHSQGLHVLAAPLLMPPDSKLSACPCRKHGAAPSVPKTQGFVPESFSHVLLDAPCTALGIRPRLQQTLTLKELLETAAYQRQLLAAAVRLVQPGGYLVYSTCSISPGESGNFMWGGRSYSYRVAREVGPTAYQNSCWLLMCGWPARCFSCVLEHNTGEGCFFAASY
jgi:16S rRNA C967 or C1407 C5-methylase (RsmB/RsmF family)